MKSESASCTCERHIMRSLQFRSANINSGLSLEEDLQALSLLVNCKTFSSRTSKNGFQI